jgi:hypothetical protein
MGDKVRHPVKNQTFELLDDGTVLVEDLDQHISGTFLRSGKKVSGRLGFADPQMLDWVGGRAPEGS